MSEPIDALDTVPVDAERTKNVLQALMKCYKIGDNSGVELHTRVLLEFLPDNETLRRFLAVALVGQDKTAGAEVELRRALILQPNYAEGEFSFGNTWMAAGELSRAATHFRRTLFCSPLHPQAMANLAKTLNLPDGQELLLRRALLLAPGLSTVQGNLGTSAYRRGIVERAIRDYRHCLAIKPDMAEIRLELANAYRDLGQLNMAFATYADTFDCLDLLPDQLTALENLVEALRRVPIVPEAKVLERLRPHLITCLSRPDIDSNTVNIASNALLKHDFDDWIHTTDRPCNLSIINERSRGLLIAHLMDSFVSDITLEQFLCRVRSELLRRHSYKAIEGLPTKQITELARAFAYQSVLNEFIWHIEEEDQLLIERLTDDLSAAARTGGRVSRFQLYLAAAFRPITTIAGIHDWAVTVSQNTDYELRHDLRFLVLDRMEEESISREIKDLTLIDNSTSLLVKAQYEENPYPRWNQLRSETPVHLMDHILREVRPNRPPMKRLHGQLTVLIAGCGTGQQPIRAAMTYANSSVLGIDLSLTSLAYAQRKARQMSVSNIRFARADILNLSSISEKFDVIECCGVLMHIDNPETGLRSLLKLLKPGGALKIALYSAHARKNVVQMWRWISEHGFVSTLEGIRAFRLALRASDHPDAASTQGSIDYFSTSAIRDMLFHVQEHQHTVPLIARMLEKNGLEFLGFLLNDPTIKESYLRCFPDDPACTNLSHWDTFEQDNPLTFISMYQFWCRPTS